MNIQKQKTITKQLLILFIALPLVLYCNKVEDQLALINPIIGEDDLPKVVSSVPVQGQQDVSRTQVISVLFSKDMDTQKCIQAFNLQPAVTGLFEANGTLLTYTPSEPLSTGAYVLSLTRDCEDLDGRDLEETYEASFAVGLSALSVSDYPNITAINVNRGTAAVCAAGSGTAADILSTTVTNGCTGNPLVNPISIVFSEPMTTGSAESAFSISPTVSGSFSWDAASTTMTFTPDTALDYGTRYEITVSTSAQDQGDQAMEFSVLGSFVVGTLDSTPPTITDITFEQTASSSLDACVAPADDTALAASGASATDICVTVPVIINFSEDMNQANTISAVSFTPSITASYFWAATNQLVITPLGTGFASNTTYAMNISTSAEDLAGNILQSEFGVTFTTENASPRVVAVGLESHDTDCDAFGDTGGNTGPGSENMNGNCWWDETLAPGNPNDYRFVGGNGACNADALTDNLRIIFSHYMNPAVTANAVSLTRLSSISTIKMANYDWDDCQVAAPFGCRALTITFAESTSACGGGAAIGVGTMDLTDTSGGMGIYPVYMIEVDTTALDVNGNAPASTFNFSIKGD